MQPAIAGTIINPDIKRSGAGMTISGTDRERMVPTTLSGFRRVYRGPLNGGTGTFPFLAEHKDGRVFILE